MKKWLLSLLTVILCATLCINFVRFIVFDSSNSQGDFEQLDAFILLDTLSGIDVASDDLFSSFLDTFDKLGSSGQAFVNGLKGGNVNFTGTFFDKVLGFFSGLFASVVGFVEFIGSVVNTNVTVFIWFFHLIKVLYNLLNVLLGTSFGMIVTSYPSFRLVT